MKPKTFLILGAVTALAIIGAAWSVVAEQRSTAVPKPSGDPFFPALAEHPDAAQRIEIKGGDYNLDLTRKGDTWVLANKGDFPVRGAGAVQIVSGLAAMKPYEAKTDSPDQYAKLQVEDPAAKGAKSTLVSVKGADGKVLATSIVGARSSSIGANPLGGMFLRRPGEAQSWLVEGTVVFPPGFSEWFDTIVHVSGPDVEHVSVLEGDTVVYRADKSNDEARTYKLASADPKYMPADKTPVANDSAVKRTYLGIVSTTFDDVRPVDTVTFGPTARTMRFETNDGMVLDVGLGEADGKTWVKYTATAPAGSKGEARAKEITDHTKGYAFLLPPYRLTSLQTPVNDLLQVPQEQPAPTLPAQGQGGPRRTDPPFINIPR